MKNKDKLNRVWLVWNTSCANVTLAGIFTTKEKAKKMCKTYDSIHSIELDNYVEENIDLTRISLYKSKDGKFKHYDDVKEEFNKEYNIK